MAYGILHTLDIFTNTNMWRFKRSAETKSTVGGIFTILLETSLIAFMMMHYIFSHYFGFSHYEKSCIL